MVMVCASIYGSSASTAYGSFGSSKAIFLSFSWLQDCIHARDECQDKNGDSNKSLTVAVYLPTFMDKQRVRVILPFALFIAIIAVSTASIFIRFAQTDAPSLVIAALRLIFASLALAPVALTRYRAELRALTRRQ